MNRILRHPRPPRRLLVAQWVEPRWLVVIRRSPVALPDWSRAWTSGPDGAGSRRRMAGRVMGLTAPGAARDLPFWLVNRQRPIPLL